MEAMEGCIYNWFGGMYENIGRKKTAHRGNKNEVRMPKYDKELQEALRNQYKILNVKENV